MKIYELTYETGDPWARYRYTAATSKNKDQLESVAAKINKLDKDACATVHEVDIKNSLTDADIKEILRDFQ